ncbi:hypothetical protein [Laceyella sacchari]|jgi:hypothetical protein|uniref:Uncharacterized protein n=1 Tax=Laceyella sacchari TaxID=37482 RepID=A0ABY5U6S6_LACSH|nr:hypothetical protein [Laceyella sacchari]UWE05319.1 hypothetical protein NYR52_16505 [Laceyella sacchari]
MRKKTEYDLFLEGKKPAILYNPHNKDIIYPPCLSEITERYPYISGIQVFDVENQLLYFQNESLKMDFVCQSQSVEINSLEWHKLIGLTLGYPPKATDFFMKIQSDPTLKRYQAYFHHDGMSFIGNVKEKQEIAKWLHDHISPVTTRCTFMDQTFYIDKEKTQAV